VSLDAGARLGPYEIVTPLGAGGMGEVYKARDTRLDRTVAIKILPSAFANDPDLRARFECEARAIAALDHPHICAVHDVGEHDGTPFLVMQHLDGETLAARLAKTKGGLPVDQALKIAIEIADALDKAHRAGITHRDLKPANIMLTKSGAKLLDFGLAKLRPVAPISLSGMTRLATATPATAHGMILGTVQYMAPEQVEGREADGRADIWALGVVLYEMLTGTRPFDGQSAASVIGSILKDVPPALSTRQPLAPPLLDHIVSQCLEKDVDDRWHSIADLKRELQWAAATPAGAQPSVRADVTWRRTTMIVAWALAALFAAISIGLLLTGSRAPGQTDRALMKFIVLPPPGTNFATPPATVPSPQLAVSPDGRWLAFVAEETGRDPMLWLRPIDTTLPQVVAGTEGASYPFWSPDSRSLGFFAQNKLKRVDVPLGAPQTLSDAPDPRGGAWSIDNVIAFGVGTTPGLRRISANGGEVGRVTFPASRALSNRFPSFLPDGRHLLFFVLAQSRPDSTVDIGSLTDSTSTVLLHGQYSASYVRTGQLLYLANGVLIAQPFDAERRAMSGPPVTLAQDVAGSSVNAPSFSASDTGVLAFAPATDLHMQLAWFGRDGARLQDVGPAGDYADVQLSPDEKRVVVTRVDPKTATSNLVTIDLATGLMSPLTFEPYVTAQPVWSPDGRDIVFRSQQEIPAPMFRRSASGAGRAELVLRPRDALADAPNIFPSDWSSDGRFVLFHGGFAKTGYDIWVLPMTGDRTPRPFVQTRADDVHARFSPDGKYVAYSSAESGRTQIYVQPFPNADGRWQLSTDGGAEPRWRSDGRELFYLAADRRLMAVPVTLGSSFEHGAPKALFRTRITAFANPFRTTYAVSRDGQRFLINAPADDGAMPSLTVVVNWPDLLKK